MKVFLAVVLLAALVAVSVNGECGGSCTGSTSCATADGDLHCRCTNFVCGRIEGMCGGGCLSTKQCQDWAGGDTTCTCNNLICSHTDGGTAVPAYTRSNHFMALLKDASLRQKMIEDNDFSKVAHLAKNN